MSKRFLLTLILSGVTAFVLSGCAAGADMDMKDDKGRTALHRAVIQLDVDMALEMLDRGADVDAKDEDGSTPLHWAATGNSLELARLLIDHGADIEARNKYGDTPLLIAAGYNYIFPCRCAR